MALARSSVTVGGYTLASRVLGFVRDVLIAGLLGAGPVAEAFVVAFRIPNLFRRLVGEGAFTAAFVPLFARTVEERGRDEAARFGNQALAFLTGSLLVFTLAAELLMPWLILGLAPGFADDPQRFDLTVAFTRITFPYLPCMAAVALLGGMLNVVYRFAAMAAAPIALNIVLIGALLIGDAWGAPGESLVWGVAVAGLVQVAWLVFSATRAELRVVLVWPRLTPEIKRLLVLMVPGLIAGGVTQINIVIGTLLATLAGDGAVAFLYYADRVYQLPLGVVGIAIGTALLPLLARQRRRGDAAAAAASLNRALEFTALLVLPATIALLAVPHAIVTVLFERGAFTAANSAATAWALAAYAAGLPAFVLVRVLATGFFADEDTRAPLRAALWAVIVNIALSVALMAPLGHVGIALATSLAGWVNAGLLGLRLRRAGQLAIGHQLLARVARIGVAAITMGVALGAAASVWPVAEAGPTGRIALLAALVAAGFVVYAVAVLLVHGTSVAELRSHFADRSA